MKLFELAAKHGSSDASHKLARHLEFGKFAEKNLHRAAQYYRSAALEGDAESQVDFGFCLEHGLGTKHDAVEAISQYQQSASQGNSTGFFHFALSLQYGLSIDADLDEAALNYIGWASTYQMHSFRCLRGIGKADFPRRRAQQASRKEAEILAHFELSRPRNFSSHPSDYLTQPVGDRVNHLIETGGSSTITLERDPKTGSQVAVKHIGSPSERLVFIREVEILAKLNHPCVLRIVGWAFPDGSHVAQIHTEYAPGGSLKRLLTDVKNGLARSFWNPTGIGILICGIVLGLRYIHLSGVIHRDLKPGNIMLNEKGHPLIADFGASHLACDDATATAGYGTVYYSAPELIEEGVTATMKSDVFAFGLLLYEMIVGSPVFSDSDGIFGVIRRLRANDLPTIPPECGLLINDVICRCWSMNPDDRPSFSDILARFEAHDFSLLPNTNANAIRDYCEAIREWERMEGIPQ